MSGTSSIEPFNLRGDGSSFADHAAELQQALANLRQKLGEVGQFWGNDDPGSQFAAGYQPQAETLSDSIAVLSEVLSAASEGLVVMADHHVAADQASKPESGSP